MLGSITRIVLAALVVGTLSRAAELPPPSKADVEKWEKSITAFEMADKEQLPPKNGILFIGSSSIKRWKTLAQDFPKFPVYNRGFGGSQIADSRHFADRIVIPYQPRQIVMFAGSNDISKGKSPEQVVADFIAFVGKVHAAHPKIRISWLAITPCTKRWEQFADVTKANKLVSDYCARQNLLDYIHTVPHMMKDGHPNDDLFVSDKLHLNADGYAIWTKLIAKYLK
ncbi:MAG: lysophospholipase L1-like esterase [Limisphaerales bacterium]|jgi:lysophospholipase L1-like esterase